MKRKETNLIQNTPEWLVWRHKGLGASDAPIVAQKSPYKTAKELWSEKIQPQPPEYKSNPHMDRGHRLEPFVRDQLEKMFGLKIEPKTFEKGIFKASMDGVSDDGKTGFEIKCIGIKSHQDAVLGKIPEHYLHQLYHQFYVSEVNIIVYASYFLEEGKTEGQLKTIFLKKEDVEKEVMAYVKKAKEFWKYVTSRTEPLPSKKDAVDISENEYPDLTEKLKEYQRLSRVFNESKEALEICKEQIKELFEAVGHNKGKYGNLSINKITQKGNVQYKIIPELKEVDLEKYRGKEISKFEIRESKEKK